MHRFFNFISSFISCHFLIFNQVYKYTCNKLRKLTTIPPGDFSKEIRLCLGRLGVNLNPLMSRLHYIAALPRHVLIRFLVNYAQSCHVILRRNFVTFRKA